jgi:beta-galactosamide-alpha-2,3-sialyltransferase
VTNSISQLCICLTPLHVLIAKRISETLGLKFSMGIYFTSADNKKNRHYAGVMNEFCARTEYMVVPGEDSYRGQKHYAIWKRRLEYRISFRTLGPANTVYVPSSMNNYTYALLSAVDFTELVTFDDGLLNVHPASLFITSRTSLRAQAFLLAAGVTYWPERMLAKASIHYSIYEMENFCSQVTRIKLIDGVGLEPNNSAPSHTAKIMFGPGPEIESEAWETIIKAIGQFALHAYLPHPRETIPRVEGIEYLDTHLVAEDYVVDQLRKAPGLSIQIYGYDSSALIHLARTPRVEVFSLLRDTARNSDIRALMEKSGIVMLEQH